MLTESAIPFKVLIIDGCPASSAGLRLVLETEPGVYVVGEASTLVQGLHFTEHHKPNAIILDLELTGTDPAALIRQLTAQFRACMLVLTALLLDPAIQAELMSAGAAACIEKDLPGNFLNAFRAVRQRS